MKKKNTIISILLIICLIFIGVSANHAYATMIEPMESIDPGQSEAIDAHSIHSIGNVTVQLERRNSTTLSYRVIASSISGVNTSMSATIVLQRLENGRWVNRGSSIFESASNTMRLDASGTINTSAFGAGSYRIAVTFRAVNSGITTVVGPVNSFTVNL